VISIVTTKRLQVKNPNKSKSTIQNSCRTLNAINNFVKGKPFKTKNTPQTQTQTLISLSLQKALLPVAFKN
jgi:hypothetical protein